MDSLQDAHFRDIWQKERESELSLARETAVALARANWEKENEKTVRNRVDIIVKLVNHRSSFNPSFHYWVVSALYVLLCFNLLKLV